MSSQRSDLLYLIVAVGVLAAAQSHAAWLPDGTPVCTYPPCSGLTPSVVADGAGGVFFSWNDNRQLTTIKNVYVQRLTATGNLAPGWPIGGLEAGSDLDGHLMVPDGAGGVFVAWSDFPVRDIYLQRLTGSGLIHSGWPAGGVRVCGEPHSQWTPVIVSDGAGGALVVWEDWRAGDYEKDIYASHVMPDGSLAPGWPADGLAICAAPYDQQLPLIASDGAGGIYATWLDGRTVPWDLYLVRIHGDGTLAAGWQPNGTLIWASPLYEDTEGLVADGAGGVYVNWGEAPLEGSESDLFVQRVDPGGTIHPGWPARGVPVCTAPNTQHGSRIAPDGLGGVVMCWTDYRAYANPNSTDAADVYALRVLPDGTRAPGWPENGRIVSGGYGFQFNSTLAADGNGGAYFALERYGTPTRVYVQHLTGNGTVAPGWIENGLPVSPGLATGQDTPRIAADGLGGAIAVWQDHRRAGYDDIYAQRFVTDGPTAVLVSLVSAEADPDRVRLTWQLADAAGATVAVERRGASTDWQRLGTMLPDGTGRVTYEDHEVAAGERYAYRLAIAGPSEVLLSPETWVEVPRALAFALEGLRPNPAVNELTVSFALPSAAPAVLELVDVAGRRLLQREVGSLGPGRHLVRLDPDRRPAPGIYWVRLTQAGRSLRSCGVLVR